MPREQSIPLDIPPGVVKSRSGEGIPGRWSDALNVRFRAGKPEKRKGSVSINDTTMEGKARGMEAWNKTTGDGLYSVGTNLKLYGSVDGEDVINITPLRFQQDWEEQLSTTINLGAVSVRMTAHGYSLGKKFVIYGNSFQGGSLIGGIALNPSGDSTVWELVSVTDVDNFKLYPATPTGTLANDPFAMTNLSAVVTVTHASHGRATGDGVWFSGATAAHGITIVGDYKITVVNVNSYTITHGSAATSTGAGGGAAVVYHYGETATATESLAGGVVPYYVHLTNPFATTNGDATVTITHTAHGARALDTIVISGASAVAGLSLDGEHEIATVVDANSYTIEAGSNANATTTGGGTAVLIEYEISTGPADKIAATLRGFGTGALGSGFFGASGPASDATYFDPRTWAIDNVGTDAIMSPLGGTIYYWDSSEEGRADAIPYAPTQLRYAFQTEERHLHGLGINGDPMVIGWASQDDMDDWTPTATNTANISRRVREGSALVAGTPAGGGMNLIWTDTALYLHQYTGSRFVYDTRLGASNAGLIAPQAFAKTPMGLMWMTPTARFLMWSGSVQPIPNAADIQAWVFENLDSAQKGKINAHYDAINNSVDFYFVPTDAAEPDWYVTVCLDDFSWVNGVQTRTTGSSFRSGAQNPHRVNAGKVYRHEDGYDDDGVAADSSITLAPYDLGDHYSEIFGFDPDFRRRTGDLEITVETYDRDPDDLEDTETETIDSSALVDLRSSGRHIGLTISQEVLGGDWALGKPKVLVQTGGRRR
jgi:hypothetical protein